MSVRTLYEPSRRAAVKIVARHLGYEGRSGGWLYDRHGRPVIHGYESLADALDRKGLARGRGKAIVPKRVMGKDGQVVTRWAINWRAFA